MPPSFRHSDGWRVEGPRETYLVPPPTLRFRDQFYGRPFEVFITQKGGLLAAVKRVDGNFRFLFFSADGVEEKYVRAADAADRVTCFACMSCMSGGEKSSAALLDSALRLSHSELVGGIASLNRLDSAACVSHLLALDADNMKFGVLLCGPGQTDESDMFGNLDGSETWHEFLKCLGHKVPLLNWPHFTGGLNVNGKTGEHSIYRVFDDTEMMFHVSTMMPHSLLDRQQLERKRHIGNDQVVVVFQDATGSVPFACDTIKSKQIQVLVIVAPVAEGEVLQDDSAALGPVLQPFSVDVNARRDPSLRHSSTYSVRSSSEFDERLLASQSGSFTGTPVGPMSLEPPTQYAGPPARISKTLRFRVAVARRDSVPSFGPPIPGGGVVTAEELSTWLPQKLLFAQIAVNQSPLFRQRTERQRHTHLQLILQAFVTSPGAVGSRASSSSTGSGGGLSAQEE